MGFCFGGRVSYLAACNLSDLAASVVFYGGRILQPLGGDGPGGDGPSPLAQTANIRAPALGLFGEDDQNPTPDDVAAIEAELKKRNKTYEFHLYPGCGHGFHCNARSSYRPEAARDAWGKTMSWFDKYQPPRVFSGAGKPGSLLACQGCGRHRGASRRWPRPLDFDKIFM